MTEKELLERDAKRDIGAELLQSVREMKAGKRGGAALFLRRRVAKNQRVIAYRI